MILALIHFAALMDRAPSGWEALRIQSNMTHGWSPQDAAQLEADRGRRA